MLYTTTLQNQSCVAINQSVFEFKNTRQRMNMSERMTLSGKTETPDCELHRPKLQLI